MGKAQDIGVSGFCWHRLPVAVFLLCVGKIAEADLFELGCTTQYLPDGINPVGVSACDTFLPLDCETCGFGFLFLKDKSVRGR